MCFWETFFSLVAMFRSLLLSQLAQILAVSPHLPVDPTTGIQGITTDTRTLQPGDLFVALRGVTV
ncbi:hypothetical protein [Neosynechococcus sphagnicola]|uniref:hypothetical protein n=1 Tax=Neosynechococcus sphagnicola TaxID=1501145 RepID=UPI000A995269